MYRGRIYGAFRAYPGNQIKDGNNDKRRLPTERAMKDAVSFSNVGIVCTSNVGDPRFQSTNRKATVQQGVGVGEELQYSLGGWP